MLKEYLEKAKSITKNTDAVFAYVSENKEITSCKNGIGFVASLCNSSEDLSSGAVSDKIVGKAAALLFTLLGVKLIHAETASEGAIEVFERYGIEYTFDIKTKVIANRTGDGLCPMENAVRDIDAPKAALAAINKTLERLMNL